MYSLYFSNKNVQNEFYANSTVVLSEVNHFFTKEVEITPIFNDTFDVVLFQYNNSCKKLPLSPQVTNQVGSSFVNLNFTVLYLYPGSKIILSICSNGNSTSDNSLQIIVLDNLKLVRNFDYHKDRKKVYYSSRITFTERKECQVVFNDELKIRQRGYYVFLFYADDQSPSDLENYSWTFDLVRKSIDQASLSPISSMPSDRQSHNISFSFPSELVSCIVAEFKAVSDFSDTLSEPTHFTSVGLIFVPRWSSITGYCIFGALGFVCLFLCFCCTLVYCCKTHCSGSHTRKRSERNGYEYRRV